MPTQSELIRRFETAPLPDLLKVIHRPTPEEAAALKVWLGTERYESLRAAALRPRSGTRGAKRRNVVVLHGIMGSELTVRNGKDEDKIWLNVWRILNGRLKELRMGADGQPERPSFASDMMRKYYIGMLTGLSNDHDVRPFWFDWRRDLKESAAALDKAVEQWFGTSSEVCFVAHSMGGLVVRTWIRDFSKRWGKGCRLIMLGTPNHGSFAIPQVITGAHKMVRMLARFDLPTNLGDFTRTLNTFPGSLQMLPSVHALPEMEPLYRAATWPDRGISQAMLDRARLHHDSLAGIVDAGRMTYIAGVGHKTACNIDDWGAMGHIENGYLFTREGDGTVPHSLGLLGSGAGKVPVHYSRAEHGELPNDAKVIAAVREYLTDGVIRTLSDKPGLARGKAEGKAAGRAVEAEWEADIAEFGARLQKARMRSAAPSEKTADDLRLEELLVEGFLGDGPVDTRGGGTASTAPVVKKAPSLPRPVKPNPIEVAIHLEDIGTVGAKSGSPAVDFLAVGHYHGVEPQFAELALDLRLSKALDLIPKGATPESVNRDDLFITRSTRRGTITMRLGEPRILPLPGGEPSVVLAGLGLPGTLGRAELHIMVRELIPTLAQLGCRHLGSVLIGAGAENLDIPTASHIWMKELHELSLSGIRVIPRITFIQNSPSRTLAMHRALEQMLAPGSAFAGTIRYLGVTPTPETLAKHEKKELEQEVARRRGASAGGQAGQTPAAPPTFINVSRVLGGYEFSAITNTASVPQRVIKVDPGLVEEISGYLAASDEPDSQTEWGCVLEQLLIPRDLRGKLFSSAAPVVFTVDASSARIPFEMLGVPSDSPGAGSGPGRFLGMEEGFGVTRQFRTPFASAPEAPQGERDTLRILIIADPAEDAPLQGAQEEAFALAELARRFGTQLEKNGSPMRVQVDSLIGPAEATRANVLRHLLRIRYDAVHYAGHCFYDQTIPAESGWLFHAGRNERITAAELSRLDRVPPFVFSNACESGVTPDRFHPAALGLAPAFAEAFFERGVRNFICTAWPVDDSAALRFAVGFYESLLGLDGSPTTIRDAMIRARRAIASGDPGGTATWGAYQHYGNPAFRFLK